MKITTLTLIATATVAATIGLATPAYAAGLGYTFHSPTGNIRCEMYTGDDGNNSQVVCEEDDHTWVAPPRPLACHANTHWGNALILDPQDGAGVVCYEGTPPPGPSSHRPNAQLWPKALARQDHLRQRARRSDVHRQQHRSLLPHCKGVLPPRVTLASIR